MRSSHLDGSARSVLPGLSSVSQPQSSPSENDVAKVASVTSFFTAAVSPLTATLLSGGLAFYVAISLLARLKLDAVAAERAPADAHPATSSPPP